MKTNYFLISLVIILNTSKAQDSTKTELLNQVTIVAGTNYQSQKVYLKPHVYKKSVQFQQTSPGQTSPYLNGFTGNQVDQVLNGIRFNNSLFRTGPNQYFGWVPLAFTETIATSDGGNIGGTISRKLGVQKTGYSINYRGGTNGVAQNLSYQKNKLSIGINYIYDGNLKSATDIIPHSSYNQKAVLIKYNWSKNHSTTFLTSRSDNLERTDKWNGGYRIDRYQEPSIYTWLLQSYMLANHKYTNKNLTVNTAYQNFTEDILNKTKLINSRVNLFTTNLEYKLNQAFNVYSSNTIENINYQVDNLSNIPSSFYSTFKQGVRYNKSFYKYNLKLSTGFKTVTVTDVKPFYGLESSAILSRKKIFLSYSSSLNAPSYLMLKQGITTGKAEQLPNPNLVQERGHAYKAGLKNKDLYFDISYRNLINAIATEFITPDTIQTVNKGFVNVFSSNIGYNKKNIFSNTDLYFNAEYTYGITSEEEPINKTAPVRTYIKINRKHLWMDWTLQSKDYNPSYNDLRDVRQFEHNKGVNILSVGYNNSYKKINYGISIYNLFNTESRIIGSSVDLPRRSLNVKVKYNL